MRLSELALVDGLLEGPGALEHVFHLQALRDKVDVVLVEGRPGSS